MSNIREIETTLITLTTNIVSAHVEHNTVAVGEGRRLIERVHGALTGLSAAPAAGSEPLVPAVSIRASVKPDHIVCLEDGKKLKMLKRYLMTRYQMTPEQYRAKWGLPADYPMTAPNYTDRRRTFAKKIGLGRKPKSAAPVSPDPASA